MFVWRNIDAIVDFDSNMVGCRNAIVREINYVFSPEFRNIKKDETVAKIHQTNKNLRQIVEERIDSPAKKSMVKAKLIGEALSPNPDFKTAELLIEYLDIKAKEVGKDLYYDLKMKGRSYSKYIDEQKYKEAFNFLKYFAEEDAFHELKILIEKSAEYKSYKSFSFIVEKLLSPPYNKLKDDDNLIKLLEREFDNAESERRLEDIELINRFLDDNEKWYEVKALKTLLERDYNKAIKHLSKIEDKEKLRNLIIDCYWEEIDKGKKGIAHLKNAFNLAYYGDLSEGEYEKYIKYPARILFEHYISKPNATDSDYQGAVVFAEFAENEDIKNILAKKFLLLIGENKASVAVKLKNLYNVDFSTGKYEAKEKVLEKFEGLTETKGVFEIPKGEENLHTALEMVLIFDFGKDSVKKINNLLCRFYISEGIYDKAKMYFAPDDELVLALIENEVSQFIEEKKYNRIYELLYNLKFTFTDNIIQKKKSEIDDILSVEDYTIDNLEKMIIIEGIFELDALPIYIYDKVLSFCSNNEVEGARILTELSTPLLRRADHYMNIRIYKVINDIKAKNEELSKKVEAVYTEILPPTILDWLVYVYRILFKVK